MDRETLAELLHTESIGCGAPCYPAKHDALARWLLDSLVKHGWEVRRTPVPFTSAEHNDVTPWECRCADCADDPVPALDVGRLQVAMRQVQQDRLHERADGPLALTWRDADAIARAYEEAR
jgi:hypothetical protein